MDIDCRCKCYEKFSGEEMDTILDTFNKLCDHEKQNIYLRGCVDVKAAEIVRLQDAAGFIREQVSLLKKSQYFTSDSTLRPISGPMAQMLLRVVFHGWRKLECPEKTTVGEDENTTAMAGYRTPTSGLTIEDANHWIILRTMRHFGRT